MKGKCEEMKWMKSAMVMSEDVVREVIVVELLREMLDGDGRDVVGMKGGGVEDGRGMDKLVNDGVTLGQHLYVSRTCVG
jgi:hypothetical protein